MECIDKYFIHRLSATHYIGKDGTEYLYNEYRNWGSGLTEHGKMDLPKNNYPYTFKYICKLCKKIIHGYETRL